MRPGASCMTWPGSTTSPDPELAEQREESCLMSDAESDVVSMDLRQASIGWHVALWA